MLAQVAMSGSPGPVVWVHGSRNRAAHTFRRWVTDIAAQHPNVQQHLYYETLWSGGTSEKYYYTGFMAVHQLLANALLPRADYYVCGPAAFIRKQM